MRSQPPEVRRKFKEEALRLREVGGRGYVMVARSLGVAVTTTRTWFHPEMQREALRRYRIKHRKELAEWHRREKGETREAREDLIKELGGRCEKCGRNPPAPALHSHDLYKKAKKDRGNRSCIPN